MRVNLNWNARAAGRRRAVPASSTQHRPRPRLPLRVHRRHQGRRAGAGQRLHAPRPRGVGEPVIRLDGDDRSGSNSGGENLFINLGHAAPDQAGPGVRADLRGRGELGRRQRRGHAVPGAGPADRGPPGRPRDGARICAHRACWTNSGGELVVRREVNYLNGAPARPGRGLRLGHELDGRPQVARPARRLARSYARAPRRTRIASTKEWTDMSELDLGSHRRPPPARRRRRPRTGQLVLAPPAPVVGGGEGAGRRRRARSTTPSRPSCSTRAAAFADELAAMDTEVAGVHRRRSTRSPRWATRTCAPRPACPTGCSTGRPRR